MALRTSTLVMTLYRHHPVLVGLLAAAALVVVYALVPDGVRMVLPVAGSLAAALAALRVARATPTAVRPFWYPMGAAMGFFAVYCALGVLGAPPVAINPVMALAYLLAGYAVWQIAPRRSIVLSTHWLDVTIVVGAAGTVLWVLYLHPYVDGIATTGGLGAALHPAGALLLLPVMARSLLSGSRRLPSYSLLLLAALFGLLADVVLSFLTLRGDVRPASMANVLPLLSQAMVLLAALHPMAAHLGRPATRERRDVAETLWLAPVGMAVVSLPWVAAELGVGQDLTLTVAATLALVALLVGRCAHLVRRSDRLATTDLLTGLASRRAFAQRLAEDTELGQARSVIVLDLDGFKAVNDAGGHAAGDALLVQVAARLRDVVSAGDLPARLGGDEFAVLLASTTDDDTVLETARRLAASLTEPFVVDGKFVPVTASLGVVAALPADASEDGLTAAEVALHAAKVSGRGHVKVYSEHLRRRVLDRTRLAAELAHAVAAGPGGGLHVHYQPIVRLAGRKVHGVEALLRWQHPERGLLSAGEFLDLVQSASLARELDALVLRLALHQLGEWRRRRSPAAGLLMGVNLGTATLVRADLVEMIGEALLRAGVPASQLVVEITEHEAVPSDPRIEGALHELAQLGVHISLDDFGVGYTSLHYLDRFPISSIKVDKSITVTAMGDAPSPLLPGLVALARSTRASTLAEGIETEQQAAHLTELGFTLGQGYYFGRPMTAPELEAWMKRRPALPSAVRPSSR